MTLYGFQITRSRKRNWPWPKGSKLKTLESTLCFRYVCSTGSKIKNTFDYSEEYLEGVLKTIRYGNCKLVSTLLEQGRKFEPAREDEEPVDVLQYQMEIACLTYASTISRPDLAALSKFMPKPGKEHWQGIKRMLSYIQGTLIVDFRLLFKARFPSLLSTCQLRCQVR